MAKKDDTGKKEKKKQKGSSFVVSKEAKRRLIAPFIMLLAGAVSSILMVMQGKYTLHEFLWRLLLILLFFYALGCVLKDVLDSIDKQNTPPPEPAGEEGEITEEGAEESASEEGTENGVFEKEAAGE